MVLAVTGIFIIGCSKTQNLFGVHTPDPASARTPPAADSPSPHDRLAGKWLVFHSWGCGSYSQTTWTLHPDGTFFSPAVSQKGRWSVLETEFELTFPYSPFVTYTGTVDPAGENMEGTTAGNDGSRGC